MSNAAGLLKGTRRLVHRERDLPKIETKETPMNKDISTDFILFLRILRSVALGVAIGSLLPSLGGL